MVGRCVEEPLINGVEQSFEDHQGGMGWQRCGAVQRWEWRGGGGHLGTGSLTGALPFAAAAGLCPSLTSCPSKGSASPPEEDAGEAGGEGRLALPLVSGFWAPPDSCKLIQLMTPAENIIGRHPPPSSSPIIPNLKPRSSAAGQYNWAARLRTTEVQGMRL